MKCTAYYLDNGERYETHVQNFGCTAGATFEEAVENTKIMVKDLMEDHYQQSGRLQVLEPANQRSFDILEEEGGPSWATFEFEVDLDLIRTPVDRAANVIQRFFAHWKNRVGPKAICEALSRATCSGAEWDDESDFDEYDDDDSSVSSTDVSPRAIQELRDHRNARNAAAHLHHSH